MTNAARVTDEIRTAADSVIWLQTGLALARSDLDALLAADPQRRDAALAYMESARRSLARDPERVRRDLGLSSGRW